ncbi:MAG: 2-amino-4-hydroxy-6-hydroxymethyldihydropteridine diphosphokinase [Gemmataceae bacterium]|nr:2-amino-4-hydroxy-6-hydroxymethyldihydropteridine diphosphokinase [Gemmata sp.]MDW8198253.1 2-amino-4-hydroxy-6-hydroxymethyldihydropteridine diphosphokinase [Gemmataceae bacterium]
MPFAYLALGSNLGDRFAQLAAAIRRLRAEPGIRVHAVSSFYATAPVDCPPGSGEFLNAVVAVETRRSPHDLLQWLLQIERQFGRQRGEPNAPRTLDLDLLLYDDNIITSEELTVPHPRMHERAFVLVPLAEIAPHVRHPRLQKTARELAEACPADGVRLASRPAAAAPLCLAGVRALVTGSTRGIGASIAEALAHQGAEVIRHGRHPVPGRHLVADLRDPGQVDRLANDAWDMLQGLDLLVCNAGADTLTGEAAHWSFEQKLHELLAVDVLATIRLTRLIGLRMKTNGHGCILTMGWDQAETGMEGDSGELFAAVKGAVMCFTRSLAKSLAPEVRVNCLAPGWIRTAWGETASDLWQERVRRETPLGIWGLPEDIAAAAVWLASPAAQFITGQTIRINGGAVRA